jgi:hypothetical protein
MSDISDSDSQEGSLDQNISDNEMADLRLEENMPSPINTTSSKDSIYATQGSSGSTNSETGASPPIGKDPIGEQSTKAPLFPNRKIIRRKLPSKNEDTQSQII